MDTNNTTENIENIENETEYINTEDNGDQADAQISASEESIGVSADKTVKKQPNTANKKGQKPRYEKQMRDDRIDAEMEKNDEPKKDFYEVVGVKFKPNGKLYYFDPAGIEVKQNENVIVETARGIEYGTIALPNSTVSGQNIVLPLRCVLRKSTPEDDNTFEANSKRETEAYNMCLSKIEERNLGMKLVDVECTFDCSKILFYFTSEGRVDFRDLVRDLASAFHTRIELRQIGIRDEAKMLGGIGSCGRPFCCSTFLSDFAQVSIKMAKEQNLSLNSNKISGTCGRLMCCLRYENSVYVEETSKTPKVDSTVVTPDGDGVVTETSPLTGFIKVKLNKDSYIRLYHRDDVTVKGHAKHRDANAKASNAPDNPADGTESNAKK